MKKVILSVAAVFAFGFANAQEMDVTPAYGLTNGDVVIEGSLQFGTTNNKNTEVKTSSFGFTPKVGYMVTDKSMLGVQLGVGSSKEEGDVAGVGYEEKTNAFSIGVFGRHYFLELGERFKAYGEVGVGFGSAKGEVKSGSVTVESPKTNTVNAGLSLGMNYFMTPSVAVSFSLADVLSYGTSKVDVSGAKAQTEFNGNLNVFNNIFATPTIGLMYKF